MATVTVVGAGVIGLTCAVRLLENGHDVAVVARDLPPHVTSAVAAAIWYPYLAEPRDRVTAWSAASYAVFAGLVDSGAGVTMVPGTEVFRERSSVPWWAAAVPDLVRVPEPAPGYADGWSFSAPVIEMPVYLQWLLARVAALGGTVTQSVLTELPGGLVVNAAGLGARELVNDSSMEPVRGQVVYVEQVGVDRWWIDDSDGTTYVIPRSSDIVVGGTEEHGASDLEPVPATADAIVDRASALVPALRSARVLGHNVGLRPARPSVRLGREGDVIHCYGHGGAGVTLSWGCADEVAGLL